MKTTPCKGNKQAATQHYAYFEAPRCGAKTRKGSPCESPAVNRKTRCRMHGGADGSGAPKNNQNALKHGASTHEMKQLKRDIKALLLESTNLMNHISS